MERSPGEVGLRAVLQRVSRAEVKVDGETVSAIDTGILALVGVAEGDTDEDAAAIAGKITGLRIFPDEGGKMNRAVTEAGGSVLVVSQFTLLADVRRGRRPSFTGAADPDVAQPLLEGLCGTLESLGVAVETGRFGAMMEVNLVNDGPVTILLEARDGKVG